MKNTAILLAHCQDQKGIVAASCNFLAKHNGNIEGLDQHVDCVSERFFMRIEWDLTHFSLDRRELESQFKEEIAEQFTMDWQINYSDYVPKVALFVSKMSHCLVDILSRWQSGEWKVEIPLIISNHEDMRFLAEKFDIPYFCFPITKENKVEQEAKEIALLDEHNIDCIILARYMQVITEDFIRHYPNKIINIHHSSLPAFPGAKPYHSAHERGVKIIGATSHYVTADLDAGPIIEQDVVRITHRDSVKDLVRKGRDLEKLVLSRGVWKHLQRKVLHHDNKTVVFN
ncbi:MAG: formyltetrahydrofolate deformylase [Cyclobacteriaceae bacterium]